MINVFSEHESLVFGMSVGLGICDVEEGWPVLWMVEGRTHPWSKSQESFAVHLGP